MSLLRRLSIQSKLMLSMGLCLLLFIAISSTLSVTMSSAHLRERVVGTELPAQVGQIRNGTPDDGTAGWQAYATRVKAFTHAATVFWVSADSGKYFMETGYDRCRRHRRTTAGSTTSSTAACRTAST